MNIRLTAAVAAILAGGLLAGCSAAQHPPSAMPTSSELGFFDPCDPAMTAWFAARGYHHPEYIEPILDEIGSNCSYTSKSAGFAVMSRESIPGDGIDRRLHHLLGIQGPVSHTTLVGYPTALELVNSRKTRQHCHLVVTVDYGYLEVTGGPNGILDDTFPRDCDAAQTFTAMLLHRMDQVWPG